MSKAVQFKMPAAKAQSADAWVDQGIEAHLKPVENLTLTPVATKRLTLDVPLELHTRFKSGCAQRGETMVERVCRFIEAEFPAAVKS
jgi:hypothetical protein